MQPSPTRILKHADLFVPRDPAIANSQDAFEQLSDMVQARSDHTATLLPDGHVLIAGGRGDGSVGENAGIRGDAEIFAFRSFSALSARMQSPRFEHTATLVDGAVLLAGGEGPIDDLDSAEWFSSGAFTAAGGVMSQTRKGHTATLLR